MRYSKLAMLVSAVTLAPLTYAEDTSKEQDIMLEEVVVTGTSRPKDKIETTNATTTFSEDEMKRLAPASVGELVRSIPGFHAEDTGGETGNNVAPRGFPLSTQTEFTALLRDGMTVFYNQDVLFTQNDRFTRLSSFVGDVEAIRGGASSIFVGSAPAGFINFISREGAQETMGDIAFETNTNDRLGINAWVSGAINDQLTYALGGWYRQDDSARDPGYTANQGGELNGNLKYEFSEGNGFTKVEFNKQNDKSFFFIPQPLTGSTTNAQTIPGGMDIQDGTTGNSVRARLLTLPNTPSGDIALDITDGNFADVTYFGNTTEVDLNETWKVRNQIRFTDVFTTFTGIINVGNAESLDTKAQNIFDANQAALASAVSGTDLLYEIRDAGTGLALADYTDVDSFNGNGMGINAGFWHRRFEADNVQNDLRFQNELDGFAGGGLYTTFGLFFSNINGQVTDYRINTLQSIEPSPQRLDIVFQDEFGDDIASGTYKGIQSGSHGFGNIIYSEKTVAPYIDVELETGNLTFNFGARYENLSANGEAENGANYAISSFASDTDALNGNIELPFGTGTYRDFTLDYSELAWTIAANLSISDDLAFFARYADGFRMPDVDKYSNILAMQTNEEIEDFNSSNRRETEPASTVMAELGLKYSDGAFKAFVTAYLAKAEDLFFNVPTVVNGEIVQRQAFRNTETLGVEAEIDLNIIGGWYAGISATFQQPEFVDTPAAEFIQTDGTTGSVDINGNLPVRVPENFGQITTRYEFDKLILGPGSIHASYSWSGKRYADDANTAELPSYGMLNIGASMETEDGFYVRADIKNVNNSEGLSEGDPRAGETVAGQTSTFNARVVLPRTASLTIGKRF